MKNCDVKQDDRRYELEEIVDAFRELNARIYNVGRGLDIVTEYLFGTETLKPLAPENDRAEDPSFTGRLRSIIAGQNINLNKLERIVNDLNEKCATQ